MIEEPNETASNLSYTLATLDYIVEYNFFGM